MANGFRNQSGRIDLSMWNGGFLAENFIVGGSDIPGNILFDENGILLTPVEDVVFYILHDEEAGSEYPDENGEIYIANFTEHFPYLLPFPGVFLSMT